MSICALESDALSGGAHGCRSCNSKRETSRTTQIQRERESWTNSHGTRLVKEAYNELLQLLPWSQKKSVFFYITSTHHIFGTVFLISSPSSIYIYLHKPCTVTLENLVLENGVNNVAHFIFILSGPFSCLFPAIIAKIYNRTDWMHSIQMLFLIFWSLPNIWFWTISLADGLRAGLASIIVWRLSQKMCNETTRYKTVVAWCLEAH